MESTLRLCQLKGSPEGQLLGAITICQELQRLLKFAFIGEREPSLVPSLQKPLLFQHAKKKELAVETGCEAVYSLVHLHYIIQLSLLSFRKWDAGQPG